ncbi:MAG: PKD domain-containing protein [Bacteroidia bacterium]
MKFKHCRALLIGFLVLGSIPLVAQRPYWEMMHDSLVDLPGATAAFERFWQGKTPEKGQGYKQFLRWQYMQQLRADANGKVPPEGYEEAEMQRWEANEGNARHLSTVPTGNWTLLGPLLNPVNTSGQPEGLGRCQSVAFHPTDPNTYYVGTAAGGLWVTTNTGATWTTTTDFLPSIGVSAIAITPSNPNIQYIGIGDKDANDASSLGTYKSINGGATWTVSNTGMGNRDVHCLIFDPDDDTKLIAATNNGVYRSINSGANWTQTLAAGTVYQVGYRPGSTTEIYALNNANLYTSTDDGATWNPGVAVGASTGRSAFATTPASPLEVFVVKDIGANPVFHSADGGATFTNVQTDGKLLLNSNCAGGGTGGQGWYDICIAVDPANASNVMVGGVSIWKSTNGGASFNIAGCWSSMGTNVHADHHWMAWSPHFPSRLLVCNDGGLYRTDNLGTSYTYMSSGVAVSQMYRMAQSTTRPHYVVAGLQDNGMIIGHLPTWTISIGGDGLECAVDPTDDNYQYGSYVNGVIRRSQTAGAFWTTIAQNGMNGITETGPWLTPYAVNPANPNIMVAGYTSIFRTTNVKAFPPSWTNVLSLSGSSFRDITFLDGNTAYASRANGEFYQSLDAGLTWTLKTNPPGGAAKDITGDPNNPQNIWVASGNDVYKSVDGGTTWTLWDTGLPGISCLTVAYDKIANAVYCGMWTGVYYRHASGPSWTAFMTNLPKTQAMHLQIYYDNANCVGNHKLRLGTYGRGMWESDLFAPSTMLPAACFGADTLGACAAIGSVILQDSSAFGPTSWLWSITGPGTATFINSTSATSQNPEVTFSAPGTYTVTLTATNANGADVNSKPSYITVSNCVLPVEGMEFHALPTADGVSLYWEPVGEPGDGDWYLERSLQPDLPGHVWMAAEGGDRQYSAMDRDVQGSAIWYYRIRQTNRNGDSRLSAWRMVDLNGPMAELRVFPNPTTGDFRAAFALEQAGHVQMEMLDMAGRRAWREEFLLGEGMQDVEVRAGGLARGMYVLRVSAEGFQALRRVVVE